jgi:hypothetical protein
VDQIAIVEKQLAMKGIKMAKHEDPDVLFEKLATVVNKFCNSTPVESEDQIATVMEKAPDMYLSAITSTLERRGTNLTLGNLQLMMKELYHIWRAKREDREDDDEDAPKMALGGADSIKCYNCGADGHTAFECPLKRKRWPRFTGTCNCGKQGHKDADCWDKEENAHKRPKNWRVNNKEAGNAAVDSVEYLLMAMDVPNPINNSINKVNSSCNYFHMKYCRHIKCKETALITKDNPKSINGVCDEEIWVGDSGATTDLTMRDNHIINIRPVKSNENMIMILGNGNDVCPSKVGDIIGKKVNKNGEDQLAVRIKEVMHSPISRFNLFSLHRKVALICSRLNNLFLFSPFFLIC